MRERAGPPEGPPRILIVEDNEANLDVLQRRLERRGYRTAVARNGREACDRLRGLRPALVLMDLEMPLMSGFDALREIRAMPEHAATRIAALTAHATKEIEQQCNAAGFDDFLTKPINFPELLALVAAAGLAPDPSDPAPSSAGDGG